MELAIQILLSVFLIVGIYQFYFWCQRNHRREPRTLRIPLDDRIAYRPEWVWIYSFLYYPVIVYINFTMESPRQFLFVAMSYLVLLGMQMAFFVWFPVVTPQEWRVPETPRNRSERFLAFVQSFDKSSNCFPSMHTSVAILTAFHLAPRLGGWAFAFPALIGVSCVYTKSHYVLDLPAGAVLGWIAFAAYRAAYPGA
jgi:membrane-associated phospholipid phosphatase